MDNPDEQLETSLSITHDNYLSQQMNTPLAAPKDASFMKIPNV